MRVLEGSYDTHIHVGPSLFPRKYYDKDLVEEYKQKGMGGMVLKNHHDPTAARARLLTAVYNFPVFGSLVLNNAVGGLNPATVQAQLQLGAKVVWFPTIDAAAHYDPTPDHQPISLLQDDGTLKHVVKEIITIANTFKVTIGTGHVSQQEIEAVLSFCENKMDSPIVLTHALFRVPKYTVNQLKKLVRDGVYIEMTALSRRWGDSTIEQITDVIQTIGKEHCILSSDGGQQESPSPYTMMKELVNALKQAGIDDTTLSWLVHKNPKKILGIA